MLTTNLADNIGDVYLPIDLVTDRLSGRLKQSVRCVCVCVCVRLLSYACEAVHLNTQSCSEEEIGCEDGFLFPRNREPRNGMYGPRTTQK